MDKQFSIIILSFCAAIYFTNGWADDSDPTASAMQLFQTQIQKSEQAANIQNQKRLDRLGVSKSSSQPPQTTPYSTVPQEIGPHTDPTTSAVTPQPQPSYRQNQWERPNPWSEQAQQNPWVKPAPPGVTRQTLGPNQNMMSPNGPAPGLIPPPAITPPPPVQGYAPQQAPNIYLPPGTSAPPTSGVPPNPYAPPPP